MKNIKIGILRETKNPPDRRVAITPKQGVELLKRFPNVELFVQSSPLRAFSDNEYSEQGLHVVENIENCDILIGVKEVDILTLISGKTYLFFSHTGKKQHYNRKLLQEILKKKIRLIDYEYLTDQKGVRIVAFGHWAGVVGAYNGIMAFGLRNKLFNLKRASDCFDVHEMLSELNSVKIPPVKILVTGGGRVAGGALEILNALKIKMVSPEEFLSETYDFPVFAQLDPCHYVKRKDGKEFDMNHFFESPQVYESVFQPYTKVTDIFMACHFWNENSPVFITKADLEAPDFHISIIADISCDVAGPIASTIRPSKIAEPFYGYNPRTHIEQDPFVDENITVMAVDNLPGEVPRESSEDFAKKLVENILPYLIEEDIVQVIERAEITTKEGTLGRHFLYLENFALGNE